MERCEHTTPVDLFVIGGGINGTGIARDAAGREVSVMLAEMGDLAGVDDPRGAVPPRHPGLRAHGQKMTVAARTAADGKTLGHRSWRAEMSSHRGATGSSPRAWASP